MGSSVDFDHHSSVEEGSSGRNQWNGQLERMVKGPPLHRVPAKQGKPIDLLRKVNGNHVCADCGSHDPDWASLNLGVLVCIECSGVHRNLGVHISKVKKETKPFSWLIFFCCYERENLMFKNIEFPCRCGR